MIILYNDFSRNVHEKNCCKICERPNFMGNIQYTHSSYGVLRDQVLAGIQAVDASAYSFTFDEQRDVTAVELAPIPELAIDKPLLLEVYYNPQRSQYDSSESKFLASVRTPHLEPCPFCNLPQGQKIAIDGTACFNINGREYEIAANKNPYFANHLNLLTSTPQAQYLTLEKTCDLLTFQCALGCDFAGHYHGINGGATVLHFHGQFRTGVTPLWKNLQQKCIALEPIAQENGIITAKTVGWPAQLLVFLGKDIGELVRILWRKIQTLLDANIPHNLDWMMEEDGTLKIALDILDVATLEKLPATVFPILYGAVVKAGKIMVNNDGMELFQSQRDQFLSLVVMFLHLTTLEVDFEKKFSNTF